MKFSFFFQIFLPFISLSFRSMIKIRFIDLSSLTILVQQISALYKYPGKIYLIQPRDSFVDSITSNILQPNTMISVEFFRWFTSIHLQDIWWDTATDVQQSLTFYSVVNIPSFNVFHQLISRFKTTTFNQSGFSNCATSKNFIPYLWAV